jgi:hypothetical protein
MRRETPAKVHSFGMARAQPNCSIRLARAADPRPRGAHLEGHKPHGAYDAITDTAGHELADHDATMSNIELIGPVGKGGGHAEAQSKFPMRYRPAVKPRDGRNDRSETPTGCRVAEHVLTTPSFCPERPPGMRQRRLRRHRGIGARRAPCSVPRFEAKREGLARRVRSLS